MTSRADEPWGHAEEIDDIGGQVAIVGIGEAEHSRASGRTSREIAATAVERAIGDAGLEPADIDGIMWSPFAGPQMDAEAFHAHFGVNPSQARRLPAGQRRGMDALAHAAPPATTSPAATRN